MARMVKVLTNTISSALSSGSNGHKVQDIASKDNTEQSKPRTFSSSLFSKGREGGSSKTFGATPSKGIVSAMVQTGSNSMTKSVQRGMSVMKQASSAVSRMSIMPFRRNNRKAAPDGSQNERGSPGAKAKASAKAKGTTPKAPSYNQPTHTPVVPIHEELNELGISSRDLDEFLDSQKQKTVALEPELDEIDLKIKNVKNRMAAPASGKSNAKSRKMPDRSGTQGIKAEANGSECRKADVAQKNDLCWHESKVDIIIAFQLYELLQRKWRFHGRVFMENPQSTDSEIIQEMTQRTDLVKEERIAHLSRKHKVTLLQRCLAACRSDVESCLLSEQNAKAFLDHTVGGHINFDTNSHLDFLKKHPQLGRTYEDLMFNSLDGSTDEVLNEYRKPEINSEEMSEIRCNFEAELRAAYPHQREKTFRIGDLKDHPDLGILDFQFFDIIGDDGRMSVEGFAAVMCPPTSRTRFTVTRAVAHQVERRLQQVLDANVVKGDDVLKLDVELRRYEDPFNATLSDSGAMLYHELYNYLDWSDDSDSSQTMKAFLDKTFSEANCKQYQFRPEKVGSLTINEFTGLVIPDGYKRRPLKDISRNRGAVAPASNATRTAINGMRANTQGLHTKKHLS